MGSFKFIETGFEGMLIIEPGLFEDNRGYFMETYSRKAFAEYGIDKPFVQDNQSRSKKGVLRGLHFQIRHPQAKLVRVISGEIFDAAVDIRSDSATFGKWFGILLSDANKKQLYIPQGFAHGFLVLSEVAEICYKCTDFYFPQAQRGIIWNDPEIGIRWPIENIREIILSDKDRYLPQVKDCTELTM